VQKTYLRIRNILSVLILIFLFQIGQATEPPEFSGKKAFDYLRKQVEFGPRNPGSEGHQQTKYFLLNEMRKFTPTVIDQSFIYYDKLRNKTLTLTNIIARFQVKKEPRILISAHWDTRPWADQDPNPANRSKPILGANDGASGVAVLLELASILSQNPPPVGVDLVLFDGEDYGREGHLDEYFLGSRYFAANNTQFFPIASILLDMVGDANLQLPIEGYSQQYAPNLVRKVWDIAATLGESAFLDIVNGYISDDHVILNENGIPTIDIIDFAYPDQTNRYWHTLKDTPDKCSPESLETVGRVMVYLIYRTQW